MGIGVQPSTTSVVVTDGDGQSGTIDAATEKSAGCMTAMMVRQLNTLWKWRVGIEAGSDAGTPLDVITRPELEAAIAGLRLQQSAPAALTQQFDTRRLLARVDALEQAAQRPPSTALTLPGAGPAAPMVADDAVQIVLDQIKHDIAMLSQRLAGLEAFANELIATLPEQLKTTADIMGRDGFHARLTRVEEIMRVIIEESHATAAAAEGAA